MADSISRRHVDLGFVKPTTLPNGVIVPPALRINTETLEEHQARMRRQGLRKVSASEAAAMGYSATEITRYFGPPSEELLEEGRR